MKTHDLLPLAAAGILLAGCSRPKLEASLDARPGPARIQLKGRSLGTTPRVVRVGSMAEVLDLSASMDQAAPSETRIRVLSPTSAEVTFFFGEGSSVMAKALGLPRILVFDYGAAPTFEVDKADLAPVFTDMLVRQAELLTGHFRGIPVYVCGHTDPTGSVDHNAVLSLRRAQAVAERLLAGGVEASLVKAQGFGSAYPVASNDTAPGRALNRRTEIILPQ
jgi:outer membrane protein OmpA-like peptidoglycan-associated protein